MYRVIENQHLANLRQIAGPVLLICEEDRPAILRHLLAQVTLLRGGTEPIEALGTGPEALSDSRLGQPAGWVVPVRVVRSRFCRGEDWGSRTSRWLGTKTTSLADWLNNWLGARVELVCEAPIAVGSTRTWTEAAAVARSVLRHVPAPFAAVPRFPPGERIWPSVQETLDPVPPEARHWLRRMATDYDVRAARILRAVVLYLGQYFFRGIWVYGVAGIENLPPGARLVYLPCHRSHFDYMVLPYALNELGQTCPVFAAGDNLNFFPAGPIIKHSFAFFIRRTFGSDTAYRNVCASYLGALLKHDVPMAFFPEGGRSRDGRMRSPKIGMLHMVREQAAHHCDDDAPIYVVPMHVAYERCPDGKSLARQSLG
ncbi:MAG: 1-acyl-sn-glycerol-3-phosphate acyltransferase, partial [Candidatus Sericytochromatia bacterium]|nr:1-acyl-sn-glycerol-3-phosphate acyltransferase [Candidatus Sericytochromatia bacterium]